MWVCVRAFVCLRVCAIVESFVLLLLVKKLCLDKSLTEAATVIELCCMTWSVLYMVWCWSALR